MKTRTMPEIEIALKPSIGLSTSMTVVASIGLWIIVAYVPDWRLQLALAVWLLLTTVYHVLRDGLQRFPKSWKSLHVTAHGELRVTNVTGQTFTPTLSADTTGYLWLTILNFEKNNGSVFPWTGLPPLILFMPKDADNYRRLRVWLRWWPHQPADLAETP